MGFISPTISLYSDHTFSGIKNGIILPPKKHQSDNMTHPTVDVIGMRVAFVRTFPTFRPHKITNKIRQAIEKGKSRIDTIANKCGLNQRRRELKRRVRKYALLLYPSGNFQFEGEHVKY